MQDVPGVGGVHTRAGAAIDERTAGDDRAPVWVAATNLVAGDAVETTSFVRADVRLADGMNAYLAADAPAPTGAFMLRDVRAGELVPAPARTSTGRRPERSPSARRRRRRRRPLTRAPARPPGRHAA